MSAASSVMEMIAPADVQAVADEATRAAVQFVQNNRVAVVDYTSLQRAVLIRTAIGEKKNEIAAKLAKPKSWAYSLHKWFCGLETAALAPYEQLDAYERDQIKDFKADEDRKRQEQERDEAEQRRKDEEVRLLLEAAQLENAGEHTLAAAAVEQALSTPAPVVVIPDRTRTVEGLKFRTEWKWRPSARAMELVPREFLCLDEKKINGYVRSMKGSGKIPGVEIYSEQVPVR